jgi:hypothetical protein
MPVPTRPVDGAEIATDWGQEVHDHTFAPAGCRVSSSAPVEMAPAAAYTNMPLDTAEDDPGGWLDAANDRIVVPADRGGLYLMTTRAISDNGEDTDETRVQTRVNGAEVFRTQLGNEGATAVHHVGALILALTAGDIITVRALQVGSGDRADVEVRELAIVRLGAEIGG